MNEGDESGSCLHCGVTAHHRWTVEKHGTTNRPRRGVINGDPTYTYFRDMESEAVQKVALPGLVAGQCMHCKKFTFWYEGRLIHPLQVAGPTPNPDLPDAVKQIIEEARAVLSLSPVAACALARLALEMLCRHLQYKGNNLNEMIGSMVASEPWGPRMQRAADTVRIIGNDAVHAGQIDAEDTISIAEMLLRLINGIADAAITHPKQLDQIYDGLPEGPRKSAAARDSKRISS